MNIISLSEATADDIGKVVCSNAHVHEKVSDVTCGGVASGMIAYISSKGHGIAIALTDIKDTSGNKGEASLNLTNANTGASNYVVARPTSYSGVSVWRIPATTDISNMVGADGCLNYTNLRDMKGRQSSACGGVALSPLDYWTNTQTGSKYYYYRFSAGTWGSCLASDLIRARACFTF